MSISEGVSEGMFHLPQADPIVMHVSFIKYVIVANSIESQQNQKTHTKIISIFIILAVLNKSWLTAQAHIV